MALLCDFHRACISWISLAIVTFSKLWAASANLGVPFGQWALVGVPYRCHFLDVEASGEYLPHESYLVVLLVHRSSVF